MRENTGPGSGLQDQDPMKKGLEDEEERKRRERLQKGLADVAKEPSSGLTDEASPGGRG